MLFEIFYFFVYSIRLICSSIFCFIKHPLAIGLILLVQTLLICLISGILTKTFWFSYVLFLVFLGGILVLFIYVTSLASNEIFTFSTKIFFINLFILLLFIFSLFFIDKSLILSYTINYDLEAVSSIKAFLKENIFTLNKIYNFPLNLVTIILIIYLFLTLIAVVKITNVFEGPLRPKI